MSMKKFLALVVAAFVALSPAAHAGAVYTWTQQQSFLKQGYIGYGSVGAAASEESAVELYNPAASGKILIVWTLTCAAGAAEQIGYGFTTVELTTSDASVTNKYSSAAVGVALLRSQNNAASYPFTGGIQSGAMSLPASQSLPVPFAGPLIITAGMGLQIFGATVNTLLQCEFEWDENNG
jgi:opacity protein-like surface antigen